MRIALAVLVACVVVTACAAEDAGSAWLTDDRAALTAATKDGRLVLADFSGSDWCDACQKLKAEVFTTPEFKEWAAKRFVLLDIDFPIKAPQSDEVKQRNEALQERYAVEGFPTVVFIDAHGDKIGEIQGYEGEGAKAWMAKADEAVKGHVPKK